MNKITTGILGIVAALVIVGGAAYATLSDTAVLGGLAMASGTADLQLSNDGSTYGDSLDFTNTIFDTLIPGESETQTFWVKNASDDPELALTLTAALTNYTEDTGEFDALKDYIFVAIYEVGSTATSGDTTGWVSLNTWYTTPQAVTASLNPLTSGEVNNLVLEVMLHSSAGNDQAGKSLDDVEFTFTGTQVTP